MAFGSFTAGLVVLGSMSVLVRQSVRLKRIGSLTLLAAPFYSMIPTMSQGMPLLSSQSSQFYLGSIVVFVAGFIGMKAPEGLVERSTDVASKVSIPAAPSPRKETAAGLSVEAVETIRRYNAYLAKLDDLWAKDAINERTYLRLRSKYEKKIGSTIESETNLGAMKRRGRSEMTQTDQTEDGEEE